MITVSSFTGEVHGDGEGVLDDVGGVNITQLNGACYQSEVPNNSFRIVHRFGPCSPSNNGTYDNHEILRRDMLRVAYLQHRIRSSKASGKRTMDPQQELIQTTIPVEYGAGGIYLILVGVGTPRRIQTVYFDTGSSFSWIQCRPCQPCKRQRDPLFDPTHSSSYRTVRCNDPACTQLPHNIGGCINSTCTYHITYVDSDSSKGIVSRERLSLPIFVGDQFPNFVFGCGHQNIVDSEENAGLLGLGRGFHSLVTQTSSRFGHSFSYCLPSSVEHQGYLTLGHTEVSARTIYTPMLRNPRIDPGFYFINLTVISVNSIRLQMPSRVVKRGETVIDSGSIVTHLPSDMYIQLRGAFHQGMSHYQYQRAPAYDNLDTCYNINVPNFPYPSITLHFDRHADLALRFDQVFLLINRNMYCLAFSQTEQDVVAVIGTLQQHGIEVIYDVEQERIGFYRTSNCR